MEIDCWGHTRKFVTMHYHGLVLGDMPSELKITAGSLGDGNNMGIRQVEYPIHDMQFHPEGVARYTAQVCSETLSSTSTK